MTKAKIISKLIIIVVLIGLITGAAYYQYLLLMDKDSNIIINRITAQIISVSKDTVTIRDDKNSEYKLDKSLLNDSKNLIFGNDITISYTGDIKSEYEIINSKVTENKIINADISLDKRKELSNIVQAMTIEDKAGQLLLVLDSKNLLTDQTMSGCVLFEDDFSNAIQPLALSLKKSGNKFIIPLKVIEAIQHQLMSSNENDVYLAKNGMKLLMGMQNENLVDIRGEKSDVNIISTFVSVFAKFKCVNRLAIITCDANLAEQILALNNDAIGGFNILVLKYSKDNGFQKWEQEDLFDEKIEQSILMNNNAEIETKDSSIVGLEGWETID